MPTEVGAPRGIESSALQYQQHQRDYHQNRAAHGAKRVVGLMTRQHKLLIDLPSDWVLHTICS